MEADHTLQALLGLVAVAATTLAVALLVPAPAALRPEEGRPVGPPATPRDSRTVLRLAATLAGALAVLALFGGFWGPPMAAVAAAVCWWVTGRMEPPAVRRRRQRLTAAVPHAVDLLAACLAAGLSPGTALEQVADAVEQPLSEELTQVTARLRLGVDPSTVWRDLGSHPQLGTLGRAVSRANDSGAPVSEAMLRLAEDLRRLGRAETETRARSVGVQAALPLGGCLLPSFILIGVVPLVAGSLTLFAR